MASCTPPLFPKIRTDSLFYLQPSSDPRQGTDSEMTFSAARISPSLPVLKHPPLCAIGFTSLTPLGYLLTGNLIKKPAKYLLLPFFFFFYLLHAFVGAPGGNGLA